MARFLSCSKFVLSILLLQACIITFDLPFANATSAVSQDTMMTRGRRNIQATSNNTAVNNSTTSGNCVAGGSGYGLSFDYSRAADIVSLRWENIPKDTITIEIWFKNTDAFLSDVSLFSYSAFNIAGYQGQGGLAYEAANELQLRLSRNRLNLWRGGASEAELSAAVNPKVRSTFLDLEWHHYAFTIDSRNGGSVALYLDGEQLDFGTTIIEGVNDYLKASFSNNWDVAESPDAKNYYGQIQSQVVLVETPCDSTSYTIPSDGQISLALLARSEQCTDYEQAKMAVDNGAQFVIFRPVINDDSPTELITDGSEPKLPVPVLSVDFGTGEKLRASGSVMFSRYRQPVDIGPEFGMAIEEGGVMTIGQEPDSPWGDFEPFQAINGIIDELRVWDVVRTPEQIRANYRRFIDVDKDPEAVHLNLYYTFDDIANITGPTEATDFSPRGSNPGLVGSLPTIRNEMTFGNGDPPRSPIRPDSIPTTTSPLVGMGDVVVPVKPGGETTIELKSFDPDGQDLITKLLSVPEIGAIQDFRTSIVLGAQDVVTDLDRSENKRVIFTAPSGFSSPVTFDYSVEDGAMPVVATVRLIPHVVEHPEPATMTVEEDTLAFFSLSKPSQLTQSNMDVVVSSLPQYGRLFQIQVAEGKDQEYSALATELDQFGPMTEITSVGTTLSNSRGIIMYMPSKDGYSDPTGSVFETFGYHFYDLDSGLQGLETVVSIVVQSVNDAPEPGMSIMEQTLTTAASEYLELQLDSFDVDAGSAESFAERAYARIKDFPKAGILHQFNASAFNNVGQAMDASVNGVPQIFSFASKVVRFSSQYSHCGKACYSWNNPECPTECTTTSFHATQILGEPDVYPDYRDAKEGWDLGGKNDGYEWIELEFPFPMYINGFELYEVSKPGAAWRVSTTDNYVDDTSVHCTKEGHPDIPACKQETVWQTLWSKPRELVTPGPDAATMFSPPLCPSTIKSNLVRIELDTSRVPGWNCFDAVKLIGGLEAPPGLVDDSQNRLVYMPRDGVHGTDSVSFAFSDCLSEGKTSNLALEILRPQTGEFSATSFFEEEIFLLTKAGEVIDFSLDLTPALKEIGNVIQDTPEGLNASVWHTSALGVKSGQSLGNSISLENPIVSVNIGVEQSGAFIEIWLANESDNLTFRIKYKVFICDGGSVSDELAINGKSICVVTNDNLLSPGVVAFGYAATTISWLLSLYFLSWLYMHRNEDMVKVSQIEFLVLICIGAMISSSSIIALSWQAETGEDMSAASLACTATPILYAIGWVLQYSSLCAKTYRIHVIVSSHRKGEPTTVTFFSMMRIVLAALCVDVVILSAWTIVNPLVYEIKETSRDIDINNGLITIQNIGECVTSDDSPGIFSFIGPLLACHLLLVIFANILLMTVRTMKDRYQESKHISIVMFLFIEMLVIGVPVLIAVKDNASADYGVMVCLVAVHDIILLCFIFIPKILMRNQGLDKESDRLESIILASFKKMTNSRWDEGLETVHDLLAPGSEVLKVLTPKQAERLNDVKTLLVHGLQGHTGENNAMHVPTTLVVGKNRGKKQNEGERFVLKEFGGVNADRDNISISSGFESLNTMHSSDRSASLMADDSDLYILPEFEALNQRKALLEKLSWSNLKNWDFDVFEFHDLSGGNPLLLVGWAILCAPYSQYAMAKCCGMENLSIDDMDGYHFVGPKTRSALAIDMKTLCDYLRVIENDYIPSNPYHNNIHAADVLQGLHSLTQMSMNILRPSTDELFAILLSAVIHDVDHPGKNNAFQINAKTDLAIRYNDSSVLENRHISLAFSHMLGVNEHDPSDERDEDLHILRHLSNDRFSKMRSKIVEAVLQTDMSEHFRTVNVIKALVTSFQEGMEISKNDTWTLLEYLLHIADISSQGRKYTFEQWSNRCMAEFFEQGDEEAKLGLPISPNCNRNSTNIPDSQVGFINFVVVPSFEVVALLIPDVANIILPNVRANLEFWENQKVKPTYRYAVNGDRTSEESCD